MNSKERQQQNRDRGLCIASASHGQAVRGGRCADCWSAKLEAERSKFKNDAAYRDRKKPRLLELKAKELPAARARARYRRKCRLAGVVPSP